MTDTGNSLNADISIRVCETYPGALIWRQNVVVARAMRAGGVVGRLRSCPDGVADLLACIHGLFVAIETKARKDRMREAQIKWRAACERAGGLYIVARSVEQAMGELEGRIPR